MPTSPWGSGPHRHYMAPHSLLRVNVTGPNQIEYPHPLSTVNGTGLGGPVGPSPGFSQELLRSTLFPSESKL